MNKNIEFYTCPTYKLFHKICKDKGFKNCQIIYTDNLEINSKISSKLENDKYEDFIIYINKDEEFPEYVLLHELGHAIDFYGKTKKEYYKMKNDALNILLNELNAWKNAINLCIEYNIPVIKKYLQKDMIYALQTYLEKELSLLDDQEVDIVRESYYKLIKCLE